MLTSYFSRKHKALTYLAKRSFNRILFLLAQFKTGISGYFKDCGNASLNSLCNPNLTASLPFRVIGT